MCAPWTQRPVRRSLFGHTPPFPLRTIFPPELPPLAVAARFIQSKVDDPNAQGFLIETKGRIVGSIFITIVPECPVAAIGPLTVDPAGEGGIGRRFQIFSGVSAVPSGLIFLRKVYL
jgi:hypothetical protein